MALESKVVWNGDKKKKDINSGTIKALLRSGNIVQAATKLNLTANKSVDTGNLRSSIIKAIDENKLEEVISTNVVYAAWVEFGDKSTAYQGKPYMGNALRDNKDNILKVFISEGKKSVNN